MFDAWQHAWAGVDWAELFVPDKSPIEIFIRGTVIYLGLLTMLRVVLKRQLGALGISDLLVIVLIADAASNGMAGDYTSVTDGIVLVATLIFWNFACNWLDYHVPWLRRVFRPPPLPLIKEGRVLHRNLRRELITLDELMGQLRLQGVREPSEVREAYLEGDGHISVIHDAAQPKGRRETPAIR